MGGGSAKRHRLSARRHKPDYGLVLLTGLFLILGVIVIFSIGPALQATTGITVGKQFFSMLVGTAAFAATAFLPIRFWHRLQYPLIFAAIVAALVVVLLPGQTINPDLNGAQRWLVLGPVSFQPSELVKFAMLIYGSSYLASRVRRDVITDPKQTIQPMAVILAVLAFVIVFLQRDLGTMLVLAAMVTTMLFIAGAKLKHLFALGAAGLASAAMAVAVAPHRMARFATFLDPSADAMGAGYHINQALIAVGSGGLFGLGLGNSVQAYGYLPEAANDSIFAIYAEKFGFVGSVVILVLFAALLIRILRVAESAPNMYTRLIAGGVFAWLFAHIIINVGAMLSIVPLTGITLPFLSYGGSSLLFIMASLGLVFNISRYTVLDGHAPQKRKEGAYARYADGRRQRRTRYAAAGNSRGA